MKLMPTEFKKNGRTVYIQSTDGSHHVTNINLKAYLKVRKEVPQLPAICIIYDNLEELKEKLNIA